MLRTLTLIPVVSLFVLLLIPILFFCFLIRQRYPLFVVAKGALWILFKITGIRVEVEGRDRRDRTKTYVYMSNHQSFLDGPLHFMVIPGAVRIILKKPIFRIPVIGLAMRFVGFVPVDRRGVNTGKRSVERAAELMRRKGCSFLIYPEGTRSRDGRLGPFRRGGFFLAVKSGAPVRPVTITGTFDLMPRGSFWIRPGRVRVVFHPEIPVEGVTVKTMDRLMDQTRQAIAKGLKPADDSMKEEPALQADGGAAHEI